MRRQGKKRELFFRLRTDFAFRTYVLSAGSLLATVVFACVHLYLGLTCGTAWNYGIAAYEICLVLIRADVVCSERRLRNADISEVERERRRKKQFFRQSLLLLVLDSALIAPVSLMVMQKKEVYPSEIPAIAMAAYTTFRVSCSVRSSLRARRWEDPGVKMLRNVALLDALVSVLSLQYILVMTFGNGVNGTMLPLCAVSSFAIWFFLVLFSIKMVVVAVRGFREEITSSDAV